jgi:hypothetical protein
VSRQIAKWEPSPEHLTGVDALKFAWYVVREAEAGRMTPTVDFWFDGCDDVLRVHEVVSPKQQEALLALSLGTMAKVASEMVATAETVVSRAIQSLAKGGGEIEPPPEPEPAPRKRQAKVLVATPPTKQLTAGAPVVVTESCGGFIFA